MARIVFLLSLVALSLAVPRPKSDESKIMNSLSEPVENDKQFPHNDESAVKDNQFASSQILENPSYDPALYQTFIPQDAVQQYVNQYTPYNSYAGVYPNTGAFALQTGYEGYLVPAVPQPQETSLSTTGISILQTLLSRSFIGWIAKAASYLVSALGVVVFGGALTTAFCTLTPFCTITFAALPFFNLKETAKNISKTLGSEITPDRVRRTAELVKHAIDKYTEMQKEFNSKEESNIQKIERELDVKQD